METVLFRRLPLCDYSETGFIEGHRYKHCIHFSELLIQRVFLQLLTLTFNSGFLIASLSRYLGSGRVDRLYHVRAITRVYKF